MSGIMPKFDELTNVPESCDSYDRHFATVMKEQLPDGILKGAKFICNQCLKQLPQTSLAMKKASKIEHTTKVNLQRFFEQEAKEVNDDDDDTNSDTDDEAEDTSKKVNLRFVYSYCIQGATEWCDDDDSSYYGTRVSHGINGIYRRTQNVFSKGTSIPIYAKDGKQKPTSIHVEYKFDLLELSIDVKTFALRISTLGQNDLLLVFLPIISEYILLILSISILSAYSE
jgi:hypothetical protein